MPTNVVDIVIRGIDKTKAAFTTPIRNLDDLKQAAINLGPAMKAATVAVAGLSVYMATKAAKAASDFGAAMAEVSTLLGDTSEMQGLNTEVQKLSAQFGKAPTEEAKALYQIISAGAADAATAIDILTVSNKLAVGGVTSVEIAADGLTTILNAYSSAGLTATDVSDALFVAMRAGKTTVEELSISVGKVAPLAVQAGVSIEELLAASAALTKGGIKTKETMTGLRQVFANVAKPTSDAEKEATRLGLSFNAAALKAKGLAGFLTDLKEKTGGNTESLTKLFGSVESLVPVLSLVGSGSKDFATILEDMGKKTGETEKAFAKMEATADFKFKRLTASFEVIGITFGDAVLDVILPAVDLILENFDSFQKAAHHAGNVLRALAQIAIVVASGFDMAGAAIGGMAATLIAFVTDGWNAAKEAWAGMGEELDAQGKKYDAMLQKFQLKTFKPGEGIDAKAIASMRAALKQMNEGVTSAPPGPKGETEEERIKRLSELSYTLDDYYGTEAEYLTESAQMKADKWKEEEEWRKQHHANDLAVFLANQQAETDALLEYQQIRIDAHKKAQEQEAALSNALKDWVVQGFDQMANAVSDFVTTGKFNFQDFVTSAISDLVRLITKMMVLKALTSTFGAFGIKLPGMASGGDVYKGQAYIVGERGPEIFAPAVAGKIIPMERGGYVTPGSNYLVGERRPETFVPSSQNIKVQIVNESVQKMQVTKSEPSFNPQEMVVTIWLDALQRNAYGLRDVVGRGR